MPHSEPRALRGLGESLAWPPIVIVISESIQESSRHCGNGKICEIENGNEQYISQNCPFLYQSIIFLAIDVVMRSLHGMRCRKANPTISIRHLSYLLACYSFPNWLIDFLNALIILSYMML